MTVTALQQIIGLEARPFVQREFEALVLEFLAGVDVPNSLPQTSCDACILRAILSVQLCGTWQSGQSRARRSGW